MASTINADTSNGLVMTPDTSGEIKLQSAGSDKVTIKSTGNVGIGTSSPEAKFHIIGANGTTSLSSYDAQTGLILENNNDSQFSIIANSANSSQLFFGDQDSELVGRIRYNHSGNDMQFYTNSAERMRIDSSGNLLVGNTSNIAANAKIYAKGSGVGVAIGYGTGSAEYRHIYMNSGDGTLYFFNPTNYAYLSSAGAWTNASDERIKNNIVDIKYGLDAVLNTQPRSYKMNDVEGDFIGFVAQELQTVIPEVVSGDPEKQLGVDYGSLVAVAFKAIQELKTENDTLKSQLSDLETRIQALESN